MKKSTAVAVLAASLSGLGAGALIAQPHLAGAAEDGSTATALPAGAADPSARLTATLKPLVDKGTITQAQADAVIAALQAARPTGGMHPGGHGGRGGPGKPGKQLDVVATALGMTVDELRTALQGGSTIVQIAATKGVSVDSVVKAVVDGLTKSVTDAVAAGKMTQAQADQVLANVTVRATEMVNSSKPVGGQKGSGGRGPRGGGPRGRQAPVTTTTAATGS